MPSNIEEVDDSASTEEDAAEELAAEEDAAQEPVAAATSRKKINAAPVVEEPSASAEPLPAEEVTVTEVIQEVSVPTVAVSRDSGFTIHLA